jgi:hypothetical protein
LWQVAQLHHAHSGTITFKNRYCFGFFDHLNERRIIAKTIDAVEKLEVIELKLTCRVIAVNNSSSCLHSRYHRKKPL